MNVTVPPILQSKKFFAALSAAIINLIAIQNGMTMEHALFITGPLLLYIPSQAVADIGKEKAKLEGPPR